MHNNDLGETNLFYSSIASRVRLDQGLLLCYT